MMEHPPLISGALVGATGAMTTLGACGVGYALYAGVMWLMLPSGRVSKRDTTARATILQDLSTALP